MAMANHTPGNLRTRLYPLLLLGLFAILSVALPGSRLPGVGSAGTAQASTSSGQDNRPTRTAQPAESKTIHAKALSDHECDNSEWQFVITQVQDASSAPSSIDVTWANGNSESVALSD